MAFEFWVIHVTSAKKFAILHKADKAMKKIFYLIMSFFLLFISCKKDKPEAKLGKIDIADAYSLVLCYNDSVNENPTDTLKLYKVNTDDKLYYVRQYGEDGAFLGFLYQPVAIYDLNKDYFIFICNKM